MAGPTPAREPGGETETSPEIKEMGVKSQVRPQPPAPLSCFPIREPGRSRAPVSPAPRPSLRLNFGLSKLDNFSDTSQTFVTRDSLAGQFLPANTHSHPHEKYLPMDDTGSDRQFPRKATMA